MKISVFINAYNEEENIRILIPSLKDFDEVVVIDHESTDRTAVVARSLGATVYTKPAYTETVTDKDVSEFKKRFGCMPTFKAGQKYINWAVDNNNNLPLLKNEWVLLLDCDERISGNADKLFPLMETADVIMCWFVHNHHPDGSPDTAFTCKKLFRKSKVQFKHFIHQMVVGTDVKEVFSPDIRIDHFQNKREYRETYLPSCEFAFLKEGSIRMNYYIAREYFHNRMFKKALKFFKILLDSTDDTTERAKAYTLMSGCYYELGQKEKADLHLFYAMRENPYYDRSFLMMAAVTEMTNLHNANMWRKFAGILEKSNPL